MTCAIKKHSSLCLLLCAVSVLGCSQRNIADDTAAGGSSELSGDGDADGDSSEGDGDSSEGDGDAGDGDGESESEGGGGPLPGFDCTCVHSEQLCALDGSLALNDCDLPAPCPVVDGSAEAAECVLEMLVAQQPGRFAYRYDSTEGCGIGQYTWDGWFYILVGGDESDPGVGFDNECYIDDCNTTVSSPSTMTPSAKAYYLDPPAYFADCLGKSAEVMTGCIFNGLTGRGTISSCD